MVVILATGLRNSVGFDWAPWSGELYATDNGRDLLGDDFPRELNRIEPGRYYGWPYFNGDNVPDPDMARPAGGDARANRPAHDLRPQRAAGMTFIDNNGWPAGYERSALVALHGSWNRSIPGRPLGSSAALGGQRHRGAGFLTGFNRDGDIAGRPVDVAQVSDGAIYISDDYAGAIYRVVPKAITWRAGRPQRTRRRRAG